MRGLLALLFAGWVAGCATTGPAERPSRDPRGEERGSLGEPTGYSGDRLEEARKALAEGNYRRAAQAAREVADGSLRAAEARTLEARAREAMGDLAGALAAWERLVSRGDGGWEVLRAYAELAVRRDEARSAVTRIQEAPGIPPDSPLVAGVLGWLHLSLGEVSEARAHLERTWETGVADRFALYLGRARLLDGDLSGAQEAAERAVGARSDAGTWALLGDVLRAQGRQAGAEAAYREALERDPDQYAARVNLGLLRLSQGNAAEAAELFAEAAEIRPEAPEAWNDLGLARRAQGAFPEAGEAYREALAAEPGYSPALKNLAILNEKYLGRPAAAIPYYDRLLESDPNNEEVQRWRRAAERLAGEEGR